MYELTEERHAGIEVWPEGYDTPVRPIWRVITIRIPDGEMPAAEWDGMTFKEKRAFLSEGAGIGGSE